MNSLIFLFFLQKSCHILVATPGLLKNMLNDSYIKLDHTRFMIFDKLDSMQDLGLIPAVKTILKNQTEYQFGKCQMLLLSVALSENIQRLAKRYLGDYVVITAGSVPGLMHCDTCNSEYAVKCFSCAPPFNFNCFKSKIAVQSTLLKNLVLKLNETFDLIGETFVKDDKGLFSKIIGFASLSHHHGLKHRDKFDTSRMDCTIGSAVRSLQYVFSNSDVTKVLVNVSSMTHSTALQIERKNGVYSYTAYNPIRGGKVINMTQQFCKKFNPLSSPTRTVRCVSRAKGNEGGYCFAYSFRVMYKSFLGQMDLDIYETDFIYDFVSKKYLN